MEKMEGMVQLLAQIKEQMPPRRKLIALISFIQLHVANALRTVNLTPGDQAKLNEVFTTLEENAQALEIVFPTPPVAVPLPADTPAHDPSTTQRRGR